MRFCRALPKGSTATVTTKSGASYTYHYRGIDDVLSLAGAALREHGVLVMPIEKHAEYRAIGQANVCTLKATFEVSSLGEGSFQGVALGEGVDLGDKATVKAETQAHRTFMVQALSLPTYDISADSDANPVQRPEPPGSFAIRDEILDPKTSLGRLKAIRSELQRDSALAAEMVPDGESNVHLWDLLTRVGKAREAQRVTTQVDTDGPSDGT
jgi:hypothetical protein